MQRAIFILNKIYSSHKLVMMKDNRLAFECTNGNGELVYFNCDLSFNCLVKEFEKIPADDLFIKGAEQVLKGKKQKTSYE